MQNTTEERGYVGSREKRTVLGSASSTVRPRSSPIAEERSATNGSKELQNVHFHGHLTAADVD